ncbi:unnamed protein product [Anisakis simplex]|uniref:Ion_trans domain-containing protein n=1 Tax=Anisakis simplex TaxID=6269 RepID=A0A0M3IY85_ANISI|nr:unnamed protein product [Anisakis simplex]
MERQQSIARQNRFFWETIFAFTFTLIAAILEVFHFVNNAWLVQGGPTLQYQRGLGSDCVKSERFQNGGGIRCSPWGDQTSTFVINGKRIQPDNVTEPILALRIARILMFISILLYVIVILTILIVCSKRDLQLKCFKTKVKILRILCIATLLLSE